MSDLVPDGWVVDVLDNLTDSITVGHVGSTSEHYRKEGVLFLRTGNLNSGKIDLSDAKYVTREFHHSLKKSMLYEGDVLVSRVGYTGNAAIVPRDFPESNCANIIIIRANKTVYPKYLHLFINSPVAERQNAAFSIGSAQTVLNIGSIKKLKALIPSFREQQKIATILTSVDEVIEKTQAQIDKLKDLKTGMMQQLLTSGVGVDGKPHTEFKDSAVGRVPKAWEIVELSKLVNKSRPITYGIVQTGEHVESGVPCVRVVDLVKSRVSIRHMIRTSSDISQKYSRTLLKQDDIIFALRGKIGHVMKVGSSLVGANLTRGVALISSNVHISSQYLLWALRADGVRKNILDGVNGSALQEIPLGNLRSVLIPVPSCDEQKVISSTLDSVETKIQKLSDKLSSWNHAKKALMQDLLTGKVRVTVPESSTGH